MGFVKKMLLMLMGTPLVSAFAFFVSTYLHSRVISVAHPTVQANYVIKTMATSSGTGGTGLSIYGVLKAIWDTVVQPILSAITSGFDTLIKDIASGFGNSIVAMFQNWANSLYGIGIWAPVIFVLVLGIAGAVIYFFFDAYGIERDALNFEEDV